MRIVHAADLHIDSPFRGMERYEGAPVSRLRSATRRTFENLVAHCLRERAELLLLAGDTFDADWRDYNAGLFFASELGKLREVGTQVLIVRGNHDARSKITKSLRLPSNVREFRADKPESIEVADVVVHGQSFADAAVSEDLAGKYPRAHAGGVNIGMLHTSLDGRPGHANYAPTRREVLVDRGYHYWALGHVHAREVVAEAPWIVYPGNLQGRHVRETGGKGAMEFVAEAGRIAEVRPVVLDVVRFHVCKLPSCTDMDHALTQAERALRAIASDSSRMHVVRIVVSAEATFAARLAGQRERLTEELRNLANLTGDVWIEKVGIETIGDLPSALVDGGGVGHLVEYVHSPSAQLAGDAALAALMLELPEAVRDELVAEDVLRDARSMLLSQLLPGDEA